MCNFHEHATVNEVNGNVEQTPVEKTTVKSELLAVLRRQGVYSVSTKELATNLGVPQATVRRVLGELGNQVETRFRTREGKWVRLAQAV